MMSCRMKVKYALATSILLLGCLMADQLHAVALVLQQGTAQLSQGGFSPDAAVDGNLTVSAGGWAMSGVETNNTAVWETASDTAFGDFTDFTFNIFSGGYGNHTLGKFRISVTTADRSLFADGNDNFGFASPGVGTETGVTWTPLIPTTVTGNNPLTTFTIGGGGEVLVGGTLQDPDTYVVTGTLFLSGITGIKLEALLDATLPENGPGRAVNGNFVLIEFSGDAIATIIPAPEPSTAALLGVGTLLMMRRRRRS
jgi:hypothetical protein